MKRWLDVVIAEWGASRDALLDAYVRSTGEPYFSDQYMHEVKELACVDLKMMHPYRLGGISQILQDLRCIQKLIIFTPLLLHDYKMAEEIWFNSNENFQCKKCGVLLLELDAHYPLHCANCPVED